FASMMGKKGQAILLDCRSLEYEYFPLELGDYQLLLLNTNVSHTLASSEYNTRRAECEAGVALLQKEFSGITHLRDVSLDQLRYFQKKMPEVIYRRCYHVVSENERVLEATKALSAGNHRQLGQLIYYSHFSLQHNYEVSCPELDFLVEETLDKDYVLGARMMGGGFGGCTLNLIEKDKKSAFIAVMAEAYREQFGRELTPYAVSIVDGTAVVQ
ncbi:MAG: galactokinase, partial [Phaeodactylibacter sp.]|nr:galactokinase [Phaeodactylibacter sp.]